MMDLIRRQDAIDEIKALYEWHDTVTEDRVVDHLKRLPSAQQWIPCSEQLPKKLEDVVICFVDAPEEADVAYMRKTFNKTYKSQGCENEFVSHMGETTYADYEVLAWMPLPEPWEGADYE